MHLLQRDKNLYLHKILHMNVIETYFILVSQLTKEDLKNLVNPNLLQQATD